MRAENLRAAKPQHSSTEFLFSHFPLGVLSASAVTHPNPSGALYCRKSKKTFCAMPFALSDGFL
jgi:hypothetical protein